MFVKLQRPPPEIRIFLPAVSFRSSTTTDRPRLPASMAHIRPAAPAPIITTSWVTRRSYMMFRSKQGGDRMPSMHEVDYKVFGDDMQFVEVELDPGEATVAEAGGMMYMEDGIEMETIFGDGSQQQGGFVGALMGAGKRLLTGESTLLLRAVTENRLHLDAVFH